MQKILLVLGFCFMQNMLNAQNSTILNEKTGYICYLGMENTLSAFIENTDCKNVFLKTENGTIEKKTDCIFIFKPANFGRTVITIYKEKDEQLVELSKFNLFVKRFPNPIACIGNFKVIDTVYKNYLRSQIGIRADFEETSVSEFGIKAYISQYRTIIKRSDSTIFNEINKESYFTEKTKSAFDELLPNDKVVFTDIISTEFACSKQTLNNIEFIIK